MLILSDSDEEALLRARRQLYAAGMMTITLPYSDLLTVVFDDTVCGLILTNPYDSTIPGNLVFALRKRNPNLPIIMFKQTLKDDVLNRQTPSSTSMSRAQSSPTKYFFPSPASIDGMLHCFSLAPRGTISWMTPAKELQRYCTKPGTCPTLGNIASHIYRINLKAQEVLGHHLILSDGGGYRLLTGEELMPGAY